MTYGGLSKQYSVYCDCQAVLRGVELGIFCCIESVVVTSVATSVAVSVAVVISPEGVHAGPYIPIPSLSYVIFYTN